MKTGAKRMPGVGCGGSGAADDGAPVILARPGAGVPDSGASADAGGCGGGAVTSGGRAADSEESTGLLVVTASGSEAQESAVVEAGGGAAAAGLFGRGGVAGHGQPGGGKGAAAAGSAACPGFGAGAAAGSPMAAVKARAPRSAARRDLLRPEMPWAEAVETRAEGAEAARAAVSGARGEAALSATALRALRQLAGGAAALEAVGETAVGRAIAEALQELLRHDLARFADGRWAITGPGLSYLRRRDEGRRLRRVTGALGMGDMDDRGASLPDSGDLAEPYRAQHGDFVLEERPGVENRGVPEGAVQDGGAKRLINRGESTLGWLRRRRDRAGRPLVDERQFAAGERLRGDFERAGLLARVTVRWDGGGAQGGRQRRDAGVPDPTESQAMARQRYSRALEVLGPGLAEVATRVCCYQEGLEAIERSKAWPVRSAKVVLGLALDQLAVFYGVGEKTPNR